MQSLIKFATRISGFNQNSREDQDFQTLVQARRDSAAAGNFVEVDVEDLGIDGLRDTEEIALAQTREQMGSDPNSGR